MVTLAIAGLFAAAHADEIVAHADEQETLLINSLKALSQSNVDEALVIVQKIVRENPNFKLAQLIYADLLMAKTRPISLPGAIVRNDSGKVQPLLDEARARWKHRLSQHTDFQVPGYVLRLNEEQRNFIVVDLSQSRLFVYENTGNSTPRLVNDFYVSMGKNGPGKWVEGDKKTPIGVYFISNYLRPESLTEFYGHGAFPLNYPNSWDRLKKRTGDGIWLHGNPLGTFSRPPRDSEGCVTVANVDFDRIKPHVQVGKTPFIIANGVEWVDENTVQSDSQAISTLVDTWRSDWESRDTNKYLAYYSKDFDAENKNYRQWAAHKRIVNANKDFIKVELGKMSILKYPGEDKVIVVDFEQTYESNNYRAVSPKRQYWKLEEDGQWRIFYEGSA